MPEASAIASFDVVLLYPHGGDLSGFILVKGSEEQIAAMRDSDEFARLNTRAGLIVERFGVVEAVTGQELGEQIALYQQAIGDLT